MKRLVIGIGAILAGLVGLPLLGYAALGDPFLSLQVGTTPTNGYVLTTDGTNSSWVATSTLGIVGGTVTGISAVSTSSAETANYVPFWTTTGGTPAKLSGGVSAFSFNPATQFLGLNGLAFNGTSSVPYAEGNMYYNPNEWTVELQNDISASELQLGRENWIRVYNNTGSTITNGSLVYASTTNNVILPDNTTNVDLARADSLATSQVIGFVTADIANGASGEVAAFGIVHNLDTSGYATSTRLYLDWLTAGLATSTVPESPYYQVSVGIVVRSDSLNGEILVPGIVRPSETAAGASTDISYPVVKSSAGTITKGQAVYIVGWSNSLNLPTVELADADGSNTYPVLGVAAETITNTTQGTLVQSGRLNNLDTSSWAANDALRLSTTAGTLTNTRPSGDVCIQTVARVIRSHPTKGVVQVIGAGRCADVPNYTSVKTVFTSGLQASSTSLFANSTTSLATFTTAPWLTSLTANTLLALDANKQVVSTSSIGANYITGTLATINSTAITAGGTFTITAASSTLLSDTNTFSATTTFPAAQIGSTAIGLNVLKVSPRTGLTTSNSESVGGVFSLPCGTSDVLCAMLYASTTGSQRLLSLINNGTGYTGNVLHVRSEGDGSAINLSAAPNDLGAFKWSANKAGTANSSGISLDASTNSFLGQALFLKCGSATNCFTVVDSGANTIMRFLGSGNMGLATSAPGSLLALGNLANFTTATSTFYSTGGINLAAGCFAVNGTCLTSGSGSSIWPFTPGTNFGVAVQSTSTPISDSAGIYASSTSQFVDLNVWNQLRLTATSSKLLATDSNGNVVATTTIGVNLLSASTISGITLGGTLANLTATNSTLTFSGTYTGATARTIGLNVGNSNAWTALQTFTNSTSTLGTVGTLWVTGAASLSSTLDVTGKTTLGAASTTQLSASNVLYIPNTATCGSTLGAFCLDTTENQLQVGTSTSYNAVAPTRITQSFTYSTSTTWTGTSTRNIAISMPSSGETYRSVRCATNVGTVNVQFGNGSASTTMFTASSTPGLINIQQVFTQSSKLYISLGTPASSPTTITCTTEKTVNPS